MGSRTIAAVLATALAAACTGGEGGAPPPVPAPMPEPTSAPTPMPEPEARNALTSALDIAIANPDFTFTPTSEWLMRDTDHTLHSAATVNNLSAVKKLLATGADPNARYMPPVPDEYGMLPLYAVIEEGLEIASTPLHAAVRYPSDGRLEVVQELLEAGANPNARTVGGFTPLHAAVRWGSELEVVQALLAAGANPNARTVGGSTPLHAAVRWGSELEVVQALLAADANPNARNEDGISLFHSAIFRNTGLAVLRALKAAGANPNARDEDNYYQLNDAICEFLRALNARDIDMKEGKIYTYSSSTEDIRLAGQGEKTQKVIVSGARTPSPGSIDVRPNGKIVLSITSHLELKFVLLQV